MANVFYGAIQAVFCLCLSAFITAVSSFLDLEELKNVHYEIDISDKPVLIGRPIEQEVLYLASKYGQRYECQLPDMSDYEKEQEEEKVAGEVGIAELLKPMETAPCLVKTKDWWTYEFCYGHHIKQYHLEGTKQENVKYLGHFESQMDWSNKTHKDAKRHKLNRYHSHTYNNGTECDITGKPREVEVRFICAEGQGDSIDRIDEPSSCVYILTIHTTRICHHPFLRPPPSLKPKTVACFPALEQDQFERYTLVQEEKERKKQEAVEMLKARMKLLKEKPVVDEEDEEDEMEEKGQEYYLMDGEGEDMKEHLRNLEIAQSKDGEKEEEGGNIEDVDMLLKAVLRGVQKSIQSIEDEVEDSDTKLKLSDDQDEDADTIIDLDDDDKNALTDEELDELNRYLNKDYTELLQEFRDGIGGMTDDPGEAARLEALAEELEASFENVEAMEDALKDMGDDGTVSEDLVEMISKLIRDVLNGPDLKDYMKREGLQLSTILAEFREAIGHITDNPEEAKRLTALADELEMIITELEEEEEEDDDTDYAVVTEENKNKPITDKSKENNDGISTTDEQDGQDSVDSKADFVEALKKIIKDATTEEKDPKKLPKKLSKTADGTDDGKVKVRVTRIKLDKSKTKLDLDDEGEDAQIFDSNHRRIEDSVQQHLENSGVKVEGGKIEFRILTYTPDEWPDRGEGNDLTILSEDESLYFKNMIVSLLGGDAELKEQSRQSRLEDNYHFMWDEQSQGSTHQVTSETMTTTTTTTNEDDADTL